MKLSGLLLTTTQIAVVLSASTVYPSAEDERGTVNASDLAPGVLTELAEAKCYFDAPYGCDGGFC